MNTSWPIPHVDAIPSPKAVFFDWDNTLVCSHEATFNALNIFLNRVGRPTLTREESKSRPAHSVRHWFSQLFGVDAPTMIDIYYEELKKIHLEQLELMPGCEELLDYLAAAQIPMAVVSNKNGEILRKEIAYLGFEFYFNAAIGCFDTPYDKPNPDPLYEALRLCRLSPGLDIWYVGDNIIDYDCALAAGCFPLIVSSDESQKTPLPHAYKTDHLKNISKLHQQLAFF